MRTWPTPSVPLGKHDGSARDTYPHAPAVWDTGAARHSADPGDVENAVTDGVMSPKIGRR